MFSRCLPIMGVFFCLAACSGGSETSDAGVDADGGQEEKDIFCTDISQCPSGQLCLEGVCRPGTPCSSSTDCPRGYKCIVLKGVCVPENPCTDDQQCPSQTPYCLTSAGICVACREDSHCGTGLVCNDQYQCVPEGPACTSDADCQDAAAPHCDQTQGRCFACLNDSHCGSKYCQPQLRRCVDCYQSSHCANPTPYCLEETYSCVQCRTSSDCSGNQRCSAAHLCTDTTCQSDNDCAALVNTPHCNTQTGDCVQCLANSHCGSFAWCRNFVCQSGCMTDQECQEKQGAGYHCNVSTGQCFYAECMTDAECATVAGKPYCKKIDSNPQLNKCVECLQDSHCSEYYYCKPENVCAPMPCYRYPDPEAKCKQVNSCYICDYSTGQCVPPTKQVGFTCTYPDGQECCPGYVCNTKSQCEFDINCNQQDPVCAEGYECNFSYNQCEWKSNCPPCPSGQICNSQTGQCEVGMCHEAGSECDPIRQNCCPPLRCNMFWPFCTGG